MLCSYHLEYEGQTYFSNVTLRDFHIFAYGGQTYLANAQALRAFPITPELADTIRVISAIPGSLIPAAFVEVLQRLLLTDDSEMAPDALRSDRPRQDSRVTNVTLMLAQRCNLRCVYCYGEGGEYGNKGVMSKATALQAVDWLVDNSGNAEHLNICFFGGEPLLNFGVMKDVVAHARDMAASRGKRFTFTVTTNGTVLNNEIIRFLKKEDIRPMVSFDGPAEYQNRNRPFRNGRGSHGRVLANVKRLRLAFPHLEARGIACGNSDPLVIKAAAAEAGFSTCSVGTASPILAGPSSSEGPVDRGGREHVSERMRAYTRQLVEELLDTIRARRVNIQCAPPLLNAVTNMCACKKHYYGCGLGKGLAAISVDGDIYPCHRFVGQTEMRMGNIADYKARGLNGYSRAVVDLLPGCGTCWARYWCGGGCFYRNKALTGDLHQPDALDCEERKAQIEGLLHVQLQLDADDRLYLERVRDEMLMSRGLRPEPLPPASSVASQPE